MKVKDENGKEYNLTPVEDEGTMIIEIPTKTGSYKIKVDSKVHSHGTPFKDLKIPKGKRLLPLNEVQHIANNYWDHYNFASGNNDFWFEQPFDMDGKNDRVAVSVADSDGADLGCGRVPRFSNSGLGVRWKRRIK